MLLRGVGTLRYFSPPNASVQWQLDDLTIHTENWLLGAGCLGAPPISLAQTASAPQEEDSAVAAVAAAQAAEAGRGSGLQSQASYVECPNRRPNVCRTQKVRCRG